MNGARCQFVCQAGVGVKLWSDSQAGRPKSIVYRCGNLGIYWPLNVKRPPSLIVHVCICVSLCGCLFCSDRRRNLVLHSTPQTWWHNRVKLVVEKQRNAKKETSLTTLAMVPAFTDKNVICLYLTPLIFYICEARQTLNYKINVKSFVE